jgi:outer membrane protein assembly factor BamB
MRVANWSLNWGLALCVVLLSGCSLFGKKTGNEPVELVDFEETVKLKKVWRKDVGAGQGDGLTHLTPAIDGETIYTVDHKGRITALNRLTGKKLWQLKTKEEISGGISVDSGILYLGSSAGELIARSSEDGSELWRKQLSSEILSIPRSNGNVVAVQTMNGRLYALDSRTGDQLWFYESPPPVLILRGTPSPVVIDNAIYAGFSNGRLMAFNPQNGLILWEQRIALPQGRSELERMVDIHASPVLHEGILYVAAYQGRVSAVARGTGSSVWAQDASTSEDFAVANGRLFLSQSDGQINSYNSATGELVWTNDQMLRRGLGAPQVFGNYVAAVDFKGYLHVMKQSDGEFVARTRVDRKGARADMLTDGEILYVYGNKGKLTGFTAKEKK